MTVVFFKPDGTQKMDTVPTAHAGSILLEDDESKWSKLIEFSAKAAENSLETIWKQRWA